MTTDHALIAAVSAVTALEQGFKGRYTDLYGSITVDLIRGQYVVIDSTGGYAGALGHVVDVDWSDGIDALIGEAA